MYQYISGENDSNSNTEWSQQHNLYQTVIMKVSNKNPFLESKQSLPQKYYVRGVNSKVTKHSDYVFERTRQSTRLEAVTTPVTGSEWILV